MRVFMKKLSVKTKIFAGIICFIAIAAAVALVYINGLDAENIVTEDVQAERRDISQSVTAAGEVVTAEEENISFSTSKYYKAMCVELNEKVSEGQHLIMYSNGTYEDAPADGFITAVNAPKTGTAGGSSNYVTFAYADKLALDITVPEGEINEVEEGDKAEIVVNADNSKVYTGKIRRIKALSTTLMGTDTRSNSQSSGSGIPGLSGQFGRSTGGSSPFGSESSTAYYTVSLSFNNDGTILPGMSAICTVTISEKKDALTVPIEAVYFDEDGQAYVKKVDGNAVREVSVSVGDSDANYVEITDGLDEGDTVRIERRG